MRRRPAGYRELVADLVIRNANLPDGRKGIDIAIAGEHLDAREGHDHFDYPDPGMPGGAFMMPPRLWSPPAFLNIRYLPPSPISISPLASHLKTFE